MSARREQIAITGRRFSLALLLVLGALGTASLVIASPFILRYVGKWRGIDWTRLASVGQAYGGVSALISALALLGVAISLVLTVRQGAVSRANGLRLLHIELLKISLDKQPLLDCWGEVGESTTASQLAQHIYSNLIVSHWQMEYEIRTLSETELRAMAMRFFRGEVGRQFWSDARELRMTTAIGRRDRRFHEVMDAEYRKVLADQSDG